MSKMPIALLAMMLSAATLSLPIAAAAQPGPGREPLTRAEAGARAGEIFSRLDDNRDGVLDARDREAGFARLFAQADANGDGQLSLEEAAAMHEQHRQARAGWSAEQDKARPGRRMGGPGGPGMMHGMMAPGSPVDADRDGAISLEEFRSAALARFDRADADGDGTISAGERRAMHAMPRPPRRQNGQ